MSESCKNADELIAMVKRNILEGISVDNAFMAAVALPRFSDTTLLICKDLSSADYSIGFCYEESATESLFFLNQK